MLTVMAANLGISHSRVSQIVAALRKYDPSIPSPREARDERRLSLLKVKSLADAIDTPRNLKSSSVPRTPEEAELIANMKRSKAEVNKIRIDALNKRFAKHTHQPDQPS